MKNADPSRTEQVLVSSNFRVDWHTLNIIKKDTLVRIGLKLVSKRMPVYHCDQWKDLFFYLRGAMKLCLVHPPGLSNETNVIQLNQISGPGPGSKSRIDSES
ncbi:hypothetical protein Salat_2161100 [Sesamum alatum]|uniref:Uncharacterized protein n=1 Tax=Sesamum alatum TaxID=300844 RepID=A0AAE1Y2M6_9LAMI|nr:hypothetical protein Salat_2161100 [Sesamum alatum]